MTTTVVPADAPTTAGVTDAPEDVASTTVPGIQDFKIHKHQSRYLSDLNDVNWSNRCDSNAPIGTLVDHIFIINNIIM